MKNMPLPGYCLIGLLCFSLDGLGEEITVDKGYDIKTAYRLAVAAECTYHLGGIMAKQRSPLQCLTDKTRQVAEFNDLKEQDLLTWSQPDGTCHRDKGIDGYLLIKTKNEVILAIRGTQPPIFDAQADSSTFSDWINNFKALPDQNGYHSGFLQSWECISKELSTGKARAFLDQQLTDHTHFFITGHSKGGAIAIIAAVKAYERDQWPYRLPTGVYAFESARPLTVTKAKNYRGKLPFLWRLEYKTDIVPLVPPGAGLNDPQTSRSLVEPGVARFLSGLRFDDIGYDSSGLGTLYYVDMDNNLRKIDDRESMSSRLANVSQVLFEAAIVSLNPKFIVDPQGVTEPFPLCQAIENSHVGHIGYLQALAQHQAIATNTVFTHPWDSYCATQSIANTARQDFLDRFRSLINSGQ